MINKKYISSIFFIIFFVWSGFTHSSEEFYAEFHAFDVGQGNSQYIHYPKQKIGFLYDAGSSSKNKHFKFINYDDELTKHQFLKYSQPQKKLGFNPKIGTNKTSNISNVEGSVISNEITDSVNITNIKKNIHDIIEASNLEFLFVFLSHPDKDHINFFHQTTKKKKETGIIPEDLLSKTMIFAGGDFSFNMSQDVINFFNFISKKGLPVVYMYDQFRDTPEKARAFSLKLLTNSSTAVENIYQNNIYNVVNAFSFGKETKDKKLKELVLKKLKTVEDNIFIWSVNYPSNDENAQSTVMSFKISNKSSLICTGDAESTTFDAIKEKMKKTKLDQKKILGENRILVLPHHGSEKNKSKSMIDIFEPNLAIISSGNGKLYEHPNKEMIKWIGNNLKPVNNNLQLNPVGSADNNIIFFNKNKSLIQKSENIISTNFSGTIFFKEGAFYRTFSDIIETGSGEYIFDFKQSVSDEETIKSLNKKKIIKDDNYNIVKYNNKNYLKFQQNGRNKYYELNNK